MKQILHTTIVILFTTLACLSQTDEDPRFKRALGLTLGNENLLLTYQENLKHDMVIRFTLGIMDNDGFSIGDQFSMGAYKYLLNSDKFRLYAGGEIVTDRYSSIDDSGNISKKINFSTYLFAGAEYNPTDRLSFFAETRLVPITNIFNSGSRRFNFFEGLSLGGKYRF